MTKVMFQVGLLGFFVSALYFGMQGMPLMDMVLRSFIVLIAVILGQAAIFVAVASMKSATSPKDNATADRRPHVPPGPGAQAGSTATPS